MRAGEELSEMSEYGRYYGRTPPPGGTGRYAYAQEADDRSTTGAAPGRAGLYYSPPGTSYTIVERPSSHHTSRIDNYSSYNSKGPPPRGTYLGSNSSFGGGGGVGGRTTPSNNKKRPISPEQVLRMFGNNQHNSSGGGKVTSDRPRRSPASSPASTTHQGNYPRNQQPYIPSVHELSTRTVTMTRDPPDGTHGFGICVKGGKDSGEKGVGVYISRVEDGSVAERAGLRPGDSILEVNGTPFTGISHEEALKMLKSCRKISMTVRSPTLPGGGSIGGPYPLRQTCSWMDRQGRPVSPPLEYAVPGARTVYAPPPPQSRYGYAGSRSGSKDRSIRRVDLCIEPGQSLGLMIRGGIEYNLGIFITGVDKDSVADRAGLMIGDQILEVNGQSFLDVTHDEAVSQLKYHKRMSLLVRDVGKVPHSCTAYDRDAWDITNQGRWTAALQMVEEKARVVLTRSEFTSFCYYMDEYTARHMSIEAFVQVILEMLNTPEKYTLVTELREIIALEDRARFDELVYRRESDPLRARDPRDIDYRHSRRKAGMPIPENNHPLLMSSLHESIASDMCPDSGAFIDEEYRSPSEDSGLGLGIADRSQRIVARPGSANSNSGWVSGTGTGNNGAPAGNKATSDLGISNDEDQTNANQDQDLAHKLSRSFDMKDEQSLLEGEGAGGPGMRRHQSMQRLARDSPNAAEREAAANVVPDLQGNLRITVKKSKPILGIAIEGGANTKHPLPRIINIHENGAAYCSGGLEVGQLILQVDGQRVEGLHHQEVARMIAESFARRDRDDIEFLVVEAKKSNLEPKPTALIFLEA